MAATADTIWSPETRAAWRLTDGITVSDWADRHRVLDGRTSAESGPWRTSRTPYLREIMDADADIEVEEVTFVASTQIGKTECLANVLGYSICEDPCPVLFVEPKEDTAKELSYNRIRPMIESSAAIREHLTRYSDDVTKLEIRMDRMSAYFAGANSPAGLAMRPIRKLFLDEVDKYPRFSGREADPIKLARERTRTFWNRKIYKTSTPTTRQGYILREYEHSDQRRYFVPCPHCGHYQALVFARVKWPEGSTPDEILENKSAWYECEKCEGRILDQHHEAMIAAGEWRAKFPERKRHRGYWINCLYSPWLTWAEIAVEFLESKNNPETLMNFVNSWLAEPWEEKLEEYEPEGLAKRKGAYRALSVPAGARVLIAAVDVQQDHFWLTIRAWGTNERSWLIRWERCENWPQVIEACFGPPYETEDGRKLAVALTLIDTGYHAAEGYAVCRKFAAQGARAIKGRERLEGSPYRVTNIDKNPVTGQPMPGGLALWHIDTSYFKDKLARLMGAEPGERGEWNLPVDVTADYLQQMCSEHKIIERNRQTGDTKARWVKRHGGAANHAWDCEVYGLAGAAMLHVPAMREPGEANRQRAGPGIRSNLRTPDGRNFFANMR